MAGNLLIRGHPIEECAAAAGIQPSTLRKYIRCSWWDDIEKECVARYGVALRYAVRGSVERLVGQDEAPTVRWAGDRMVPEFAPPTARHEVKAEVSLEQADELLAMMLAMVGEEGDDEETQQQTDQCAAGEE
jgi:hypothetical protein